MAESDEVKDEVMNRFMTAALLLGSRLATMVQKSEIVSVGELRNLLKKIASNEIVAWPSGRSGRRWRSREPNRLRILPRLRIARQKVQRHSQSH